MRTISTLRLTIALGCVLLFAGCAVNPVTGNRNFTLMSEAEEMRTGTRAAAQVSKEYSIYDFPTLQSYVNEIGQKLAKKSHRVQLNFHFTVVDSPQINAFALPGGYIYVTRGILAYLNSEAELAAVLGHEIGHVTARHSVQQYSASTAANIGTLLLGIFVPQLGGQAAQGLMGLANNALLSGYGRSHELEADRLGAEYLARSGYDPQAMIKVISVLKNQELFDIEVAKQEGREPRRYHGIFATHPDNDTRLQEVVGEAKQYIIPGSITDDRRAEFLRQTEGMTFGDSAAQGIIRENTFQHKELGFTLSFPPRWRIRNQPDKVVAVSPEGDGMMQLSLIGSPQSSPADLARQRFRLGFSDEIVSATSNGLPIAIVTSTTRDGKPFKAGVIYHENKAYVLAGGGTSPVAFDRHQSVISSAIASFRPLTDAEQKSIKAREVTTITATKGLSYAELAKNSPLGRNAEGYLRLLNGQYPDGEPISGQILKIVK
ncbi:MAG: M48 family metalloprotease [Pseudomonadota bacterium]|nr:M48 family metalloprotease [Pseudomonadota bacterium]